MLEKLNLRFRATLVPALRKHASDERNSYDGMRMLMFSDL